MPTDQKPLPSQAAIPPPKANESLSKKSTGKKILLSLIFIFVGILLIASLGVSYVAAASGFIKVPLIGQYFYQKPEPHHEVQPEELAASAIKNRVQQEMNIGKDSVEIYFTESNLTSTLREVDSLKDPQIAFLDGQTLEIFGQLTSSDVYIRGIYNIETANNQFKISQLKKLTLGKVSVPKKIIEKYLNQDQLRTLFGVDRIEQILVADNQNLQISNVKIEGDRIIENITLKQPEEIHGSSVNLHGISNNE